MKRKCLNNTSCTCKVCKKEKHYYNRLFILASSLDKQTILNNYHSFKGKKYPITQEEKRQTGLRSHWAGVMEIQLFHIDEIREIKLNQIFQ